MALKRVRFTFPEDLIKEPLIYQLGRNFEVITNIRMADVDREVGWVILGLEGDYPGIKERICDEAGEIRRFVNIYVNGEDVRFDNGLDTSLKDGDEVSIVPAVAGG